MVLYILCSVTIIINLFIFHGGKLLIAARAKNFLTKQSKNNRENVFNC